MLNVMNKNELLKLGWNVIVIWECEITEENLEHTVNELISTYQSLNTSK